MAVIASRDGDARSRAAVDVDGEIHENTNGFAIHARCDEALRGHRGDDHRYDALVAPRVVIQAMVFAASTVGSDERLAANRGGRDPARQVAYCDLQRFEAVRPSEVGRLETARLFRGN